MQELPVDLATADQPIEDEEYLPKVMHIVIAEENEKGIETDKNPTVMNHSELNHHIDDGYYSPM